MTLRALLILSITATASLAVPAAESEEPPQLSSLSPDDPLHTDNLPICTGLDPELRAVLLRTVGVENVEAYCPPAHYILTAASVGHLAGGTPETMTIRFTCCAAPQGLLLDEHVLAPVECPDGTIATGERLDTRSLVRFTPGAAKSAVKLLRCTKLAPRFALGARARPAEVSPLTSLASEWLENPLSLEKSETRLSRGTIPAAIRYSVGRGEGPSRDLDWCIGHPFGSPLVAKKDRECSSYGFRQVVFRGLPGDPKAGTPVPMYADCIAIEDPLGPDPKCVKRPARPAPAREPQAAASATAPASSATDSTSSRNP